MNATATPPSARPPQNPAPRRRWLRRTAIASACVLGLWGVLWLGAPPLIRSQGEKIATNLLGRQVRIGEVKLHPWSLELELRDLSMAGAEPGSAPQLSIARAYVDADMSSLWRLAPVLDAIEIDQPVVRLAHLGEGKLDIADIIARFPPDPNNPDDDGGQARLALYNIAITDGRFEFENVPSGGKHIVSDLQLALPFISTLASQRQIRVTPRLSFALDGSRFDTQAHALPFDDSRHTEAALRLAQLDLAPYLPYLPDGLPVRPVAGIADADLRLRFDQSGATPALSIDGTLALSGVKVKDVQEQDAIALERLDVTLQDTRPLERHIHLSQVALTKPDVLLARDARGRINLAATGAAPAKAKAKPAAPAASAASEALPAEAPASEASAAETPAAPAPESAASAPEVADTAALAASSPASSAGDTIDTPSEAASAASEAASAAP
ncbi:MAG: DUF748 domain-containing protein, partial [Ottowia sp.]|nr:DUF748 domain-containing protein [Ottowia sp.]